MSLWEKIKRQAVFVKDEAKAAAALKTKQAVDATSVVVRSSVDKAVEASKETTRKVGLQDCAAFLCSNSTRLSPEHRKSQD